MRARFEVVLNAIDCAPILLDPMHALPQMGKVSYLKYPVNSLGVMHRRQADLAP